ncbi:GNAT family N-acyltransferase [Yoonia sp. BS5-3]|uniref:L-ornithine N(alpha)-acyltransferase n=1 Tax=Yoonia phaeophyticola TaxID=3137369 RepID=A0ABZ2V2E6_9RHOB
MTIPFQKGRYALRFAANAADRLACQRLRHVCFFGRPGVDEDAFDARARHVMITDPADRLVATMRLMDGADGYTAQFYDLTGLAERGLPMLEIGRFCIAPDVLDADVLRLAWGGLTGYVAARDVQMLYGCASFSGTDPAVFGRALGRLGRHRGPKELRPPARNTALPLAALCHGTGQAALPPLLRTYLAMGGWVGDHLVIDRHMQTMHVFMCLEIARVPAARVRALQAVAFDPVINGHGAS